MTHPISRFVPAVFFPVKDLKLATEWYANLLDRQIVPKEHDDGIYIFDMDGSEIILDSNSSCSGGTPPMIMFDSADIDAAFAFCKEVQHTSLTDVSSDEFISVFNVNAHMVCKANRDLGSMNSKPSSSSVLGRMSRVIVHADNLEETVRWHENFVARQAEADEAYGGLPRIRMDKGADLLFDDNRLSASPRVFFESLQADMRVNPIAIVETTDVNAALKHVRSKGVTASDQVFRLGVRFFVIQDPDGNGLMVCEGEKISA